MTKFFKKIQKNLILGSFWAIFAQISEKLSLPGKKGFDSF